MNYLVSNNMKALEGRDCPKNIHLPRIQTNNWLMAGNKFAYTNRKELKWSKTEFREYLLTMGIRDIVSENNESNISNEI